MPELIQILAIVVFILFSAVFSASEIASAKSNKLRFEAAAEKGDKTAKVVCAINKNYVRSLSTILAGNNFVNIAASSVATVLFIGWFGASGEGIASVVITILLLIFGETCPKILAAGAPDVFIRLFAWPLRICMILFFPVIWVVEKFVDFLSPLWTPKESAPQVTPEELVEIVEDIEDEGVFTEDESELIRSAIEFADTTAHEILTPRIDMIAIDIDEFDPQRDLTEELLRYSRVPVYQETVDNVIGILPTRALMQAIADGRENVNIRELMRKPLFVHMTCPISTIIDEFKASHIQMAVVVDEFGGVMGIVTLEDIMEEIVGNIYDEMDQPEIEIEQKTETSFVVDGSMNIYDMFDEVGYEPSPEFETEYVTVGGWATEILDKFPETGDEFTFDNLHCKVLDAQAMRVEQVQIDVLPVEEEE